MKAGFLDPGGGGKKNNKHGVQATGKKKNNTNGVDNTTGSCGFGLVSGFSPFVDVTGTIHVQEGDLKDGTSLMGEGIGQFSSNNPSNTGSFLITISPTPNEAGIDDVMKEVPTSYANKLSPTPMTSVHEFSSNEDVDSVLEDVWVKFHDVLLVAYTSDGLSLIASNPNDADSFTNSMCLESWGRSNYARILIKIDACNGFSDNLVIVVPNIEGSGYTKETIHVEYEWEPPRCSTCIVFGHSVDECPKAMK
ncbi:zinc knuckle CX2CX4HX4C containing protein [Tanacetum coccineum]